MIFYDVVATLSYVVVLPVYAGHVPGGRKSLYHCQFVIRGQTRKPQAKKNKVLRFYRNYACFPWPFFPVP